MNQKIFEQVQGIISNIMQVPLEDIKPSSSPSTIRSWDSLQHLNLVLSLEEVFSLQFSAEETTQLLNVETIVLLIQEKKHS